MAPAKPTPRNATGQFGSNTPAHTAKPKTKAPARQRGAKKPTGKAPAKAPAKAAPKTPEEKSKASFAALGALGINQASAEALRTLAADNGDMPGADAINQAGFVEAGLVAKNPDGSFAITPAGKALVHASETGNAEAAGKVIEHSRAKMKEKAKAKEQAKKPAPKPAAKPGEKKPEGKETPKPGTKPPEKPAGKPTEDKKPVDTAARDKARGAVAQAMADGDVGLSPGGSAALTGLADTGKITPEAGKQLSDMGLVASDGKGGFALTPGGKATVAAMDSGDLKGTVAAIDAAAEKVAGMASRKWLSSLTITKIDQEQRLVEGFASSERIDSQDDIVDAQAMKDALPEYMQYANLREMHHGPEGQIETTAAGTVIKAEVIEGEIEVDGVTYKNPLHIICKVVDDAAWEKVKEGVYKGFSIGGKIIKAIRETIDGKSIRRIVKLALYEISLVDRPANQDARILLWKGFDMSDLEKAAGDADLSKPIAGIQAARNAAEIAGDLDGANLLTQAIALLLQANGDASADEEAPEAEAESDPADAGDVAMAEGADAEPADDDQLLASARATISKAGRTLNGNNMAAMQSTIKSLLGMLSAAGDPIASKALALYTPAPQPGVEQKAASPEDLSKAIAAGLEPLFKAITDNLSDLGKEIETIKRQPRAGGPAARVVADKVLPGAKAEPVTVTKAEAEKGIALYKKFAATEPDPQRRKFYADKAAELEKSLA